jgi:hypothetical protein
MLLLLLLLLLLLPLLPLLLFLSLLLLVLPLSLVLMLLLLLLGVISAYQIMLAKSSYSRLLLLAAHGMACNKHINRRQVLQGRCRGRCGRADGYYTSMKTVALLKIGNLIFFSANFIF